ncbi:MAG: universal stress protein [Actinobacteria bacterium]|nr:universal stress protein [Actinomycetota bacterium]
MKLIAAIDDSPVAQPVLDTALVIGNLLGLDIEVVHVTNRGGLSASGAARAAGLPMQQLKGNAVDALVEALDDPDVAIGVVGARGHAGGPHPAGHATLSMVQRTGTPLVVVPPELCRPASQRMTRILVPLDGSPDTTAAVQSVVTGFSESGVEVVALHVFTRETVPRFIDQTQHGLDAWADEFTARHEIGCPRLVTRSGSPGQAVIGLAVAEDVDLIVIGWSRDLSPGRAQVVAEVLAQSCVPVLLVPVNAQRPPADEQPSTRTTA